MNTLEQDKERFALLPFDFQEGIRAFDYDKLLQQVHKKYKLHIDQSFLLEKTVANVIFGELKSSELMHTVSHKLRIDTAKASEIALDINTLILAPLRENIKQIQQTNHDNETDIDEAF